MNNNQNLRIALVGNPNTGKTTLFNRLTGLRQKVANFPGVTVQQKKGAFKLAEGLNAEIIDLPGTYSIHASSLDQGMVLKTLLNAGSKEGKIDVIVLVASVENLKRNLLIFSQIKDFNIPVVLAINMKDQMKQKGVSIDVDALSKAIQTKTLLVSAEKDKDFEGLKDSILECYQESDTSKKNSSLLQKIDEPFYKTLKNISPDYSLYQLWLMVTQTVFPDDISEKTQKEIIEYREQSKELNRKQHKETVLRYIEINEALKSSYSIDRTKGSDVRAKLDRIFMHKFFGYAFFFLLLFFMFQLLFTWTSTPQDFIDQSFANLSAWVKTQMNPGMLRDLITDGIITGVGGVVIFIPQIAILFLFISILEETGYMSRVVFLMDKIMRKFGMSGKSIIPLISGTACAVPAVMATRTISSWKERLITILVTPFTTCAARLPVYAILIAIIIPETKFFGIIGLQGVTLLLLYLLGFATALIAGAILSKFIKKDRRSIFLTEMPDYKLPSTKNLLINVVEKTKDFTLEAGKIILAISILLWYLGSNGPESKQVTNANASTQTEAISLENSYLGIVGKTIEPAIKPLGYDWKIGIALLSSFAAREVFIGSLATIYTIEDDASQATIKQRMIAEINPETQQPRFSFAVGMSLLVFYAFAMQCMATFAVVKKETNSWFWPIFQLIGMGVMAYASAFLVFQWLS